MLVFWKHEMYFCYKSWHTKITWFLSQGLCAFSNLTHTNICMYLQTNYLVKLFVIPTSLPQSFIRNERDSGPTTVTLNPVSTLTDANLPTKKLQSWIKGYLAFLFLDLELWLSFSELINWQQNTSPYLWKLICIFPDIRKCSKHEEHLFDLEVLLTMTSLLCFVWHNSLGVVASWLNSADFVQPDPHLMI